MMKFSMRAFAAFATCAAFPASLAAQISPGQTAQLREAALTDTLAWEITEALTTEIGQRKAGSDAEARARDWAVIKLKALGFSNVRVEGFDIPYWERGEASASILTPFPQPLAVAALGNSGPTPAKGLTGTVIAFDGIAALKTADPALVKGKIVFVTHHMVRAQDGSPYGQLGNIRREGPSIASRMGAAAILIRSIGTDNHRHPHTGWQDWAKDVRPIPALALANPDADQLERILKRGRLVEILIRTSSKMSGRRPSGNVIAEVPGRDPAAGIVVVGGHLDSWDLGTGALDDAAGVAITTAAAKRIMDDGQPLRTIRLIWFGSEELGVFGGADYRAKHKAEKHHVLAESDFGADRVWRFQTSVADAALPSMTPLAEALAPLGITRGGKNGDASGPDISEIQKEGLAVIGLGQDGTRYFDIHHTADDTLDKIDPAQLRQNVAAWTTMLSIVANDPVNYGPVPPRK